MEFLASAAGVFLHLDKHLLEIIENYGTWTYLILFLIILCETGLVVTPFLPGDSLLFAAGTFAAAGALDIRILLVLLFVAGILGDSMNYTIGASFGRWLIKKDGRLIKEKHLEKTREFYAKHGSKTILLARFLPIVRTFAPFVAGVGHMHYPTFLFYNVIGAFAWVIVFTMGGYLFGNIPLVRDNFTVAILAIVVLSFIPPIVEFIRSRRKKQPSTLP